MIILQKVIFIPLLLPLCHPKGASQLSLIWYSIHEWRCDSKGTTKFLLQKKVIFLFPFQYWDHIPLLTSARSQNKNLVPPPGALRDDIKRKFSFQLNPPPLVLTLIGATWSSFFGNKNSRLQRLTKREFLDVGREERYMNNLKTVQNICIVEEIDSFY